MLSLISLAIALLSLVVVGSIAFKLKKLKPVISRGMSIMAKLGNEVKVDKAVLSEVEDGLKEGVFETLSAKYPEVGLLMGWLEENKPELFDKIADNPAIIVTLYEKYAPLIMKIVGKGGAQKKVMYDA